MVRASLFFASSVVLLSSALAQEAPVCRSIDGRLCAASGAASISQSSGEVFVNGATNFTPAAVGTPVGPGQAVLTRSGTAQIRLSNACLTSVPPNSLLRITQSGQYICVAQQPATPPPQGPMQSGLTGPVVVGGIATAALIGGIIAAGSGGEKSRPPVSP